MLRTCARPTRQLHARAPRGTHPSHSRVALRCAALHVAHPHVRVCSRGGAHRHASGVDGVEGAVLRHRVPRRRKRPPASPPPTTTASPTATPMRPRSTDQRHAAHDAHNTACRGRVGGYASVRTGHRSGRSSAASVLSALQLVGGGNAHSVVELAILAGHGAVGAHVEVGRLLPPQTPQHRHLPCRTDTRRASAPPPPLSLLALCARLNNYDTRHSTLDTRLTCLGPVQAAAADAAGEDDALAVAAVEAAVAVESARRHERLLLHGVVGARH
eukprot:2450634-Rhodomonas_salina.1